MRAPPHSPAPSPFMSILHGFAEARVRMATYRCDECGAQRKWEADDAPESLACWARDGRVICTGRAMRVSR
jgi:hypothetical protein